jgi:ATP-dependent Clp protease ATP-binding subunit ClpB
VRVLDQAEQVADRAATATSPSSGMLLALALATTTAAGQALKAAGVTPEKLNEAIVALRGGREAHSASAENAYDAMKKYARDLTEAARDGKLDPGDRPRRGDPPHDPDPRPADQEQSRC